MAKAPTLAVPSTIDGAGFDACRETRRIDIA
jgi:hypothetical protein